MHMHQPQAASVTCAEQIVLLRSTTAVSHCSLFNRHHQPVGLHVQAGQQLDLLLLLEGTAADDTLRQLVFGHCLLAIVAVLARGFITHAGQVRNDGGGRGYLPAVSVVALMRPCYH